jgi:hypothetical protein
MLSHQSEVIELIIFAEPVVQNIKLSPAANMMLLLLGLRQVVSNTYRKEVVNMLASNSNR